MNMNALNTQIYDEASEWIILHRSDDLDVEAKQRFDAWVRESPQHLKAYLEMSTIWEDVPTLNRDWNPSANELIARAREDSNVLPLGVEPLEALKAEVEPPLVAVEQQVVTLPASTSTRAKVLSIAATILALAGLATWFSVFRNVYSTDIGEQRTLALEDGSSVELNARTKIRVAYTDQARTIELLEGQALFKVAKDPQRPFIVDSAGTKIRAVGTQFDVYKKAAGTQVTVVEGRVAVAAPGRAQATAGDSPNIPENPDPGTVGRDASSGRVGSRTGASSSASTRPAAPASGASSHAGSSLNIIPGEVLLSAGEQILISEAAPELAVEAGTVPVTTEAPTPAPAKKTAANVEAATAWTQQRLVFDFAPLSEVAQEFNRYNRRPMRVECKAPVDDLCNFNISGSFSSTDPTLLLRFLREQPGIVVNETTDEIRITREGESSSHG